MDLAPAQRTNNGDGFDAAQFKLQPDGSFRISIRAAAVLAGVDFGGLARSLKSVASTGEDEIALPCGRSLLAQGFNPVDVAAWGETGGIPEAGLVAVLRHYGFQAASPSRQAADALLAFAAVGINAYLRERLGIQPEKPPTPLSEWNERLALCERAGIKLDDRDRLQLKEVFLRPPIIGALSGVTASDDIPLSRAVEECLDGLVLPLNKLSRIGRELSRRWKQQHGTKPVRHDQYVDGANRSVNTYPRSWLNEQVLKLRVELPELFSKS